MKVKFLLMTLLLLPCSLCAAEPEAQTSPGIMGGSQRVLDAMGKHLNTIALLTHCNKNGIARELQDKVIPLIMVYGAEPESTNVTSLEDTRQYYRETQIYISGVVKGVRLAGGLEPDESLCKLATDSADEILSDPNAPWAR